MNLTAALVGIAVSSAVVFTGATVGPDVYDAMTSRSGAAGLVTETTVLAEAIGTEAEVPTSLTCVVTVSSPCAAFSDYDYPITGDYAYTFTRTVGDDFILVGATTDGQTVVFDSANGGVQNVDETALAEAANAEDVLDQVDPTADEQAAINAAAQAMAAYLS